MFLNVDTVFECFKTIFLRHQDLSETHDLLLKIKVIGKQITFIPKEFFFSKCLGFFFCVFLLSLVCAFVHL